LKVGPWILLLVGVVVATMLLLRGGGVVDDADGGSFAQWFSGLGTFTLGLTTFWLSRQVSEAGQRPALFMLAPSRNAESVEVMNAGPGLAMACSIEITLRDQPTSVWGRIAAVAPGGASNRQPRPECDSLGPRVCDA
jgi:hypothetical protein